MNLSPKSVTEQRAQLWKAGFRPVPILNADALGPSPGKRPLGLKWREDALKDPPFCVTIPAVSHALNTGILCDALRPIDIDIDDAALARQVRDLAFSHFGETAMRIRRNSPRCTLLYRAAEGSPGKIAITGAAHSKAVGCKIEVLGAGQQFVAFGRHDSGADLEWMPEAPGEITADSVPGITEAEILTFLTEAATIIGAVPPIKPNGKDHHSGTESQADPLRLAAAMAAIPNTDAADWESWNHVGMALWRASGGSIFGGELWNEWSKRNPAYDYGETLERWNHYVRSPPTEIGAGTLFHMAGSSFRPAPDYGEPPDWTDDPGYFSNVELNAPIPAEALPPEPLAGDFDPSKIFDPWNALQPVVFPLRAIPERLRLFVEARAEIMGADPCALAWSGISACSAAIHGETRLMMKRQDSWSVRAAIWVALIGIPSTLKSPIITTTWHPLTQIQDGELAIWKTRHDEWSALPRKKREEKPEPQPERRLVTHDATIEKLQGILARQSRGIGVVRDELSGWIGQMEKYAPGQGGTADRAFWLQSYNGGSHVVDRVNRGTIPIANLLTTVCGGIQPDRLRSLGDITDDGLWQRFVPVIVAPAALGRDAAPGEAEIIYNKMIAALLTWDGQREVKLSEAAHAVREDVQRLHPSVGTSRGPWDTVYRFRR